MDAAIYAIRERVETGGGVGGTLSKSGVWNLRDFTCRFKLRTACEESVTGKMRKMEGLAAFGPKSDDFDPKAAIGFDFVNQIQPFIFLIFPVTDSKSQAIRSLKRHVKSRRFQTPLYSARCTRSGGNTCGSSWRGQRMGMDWCRVCSCRSSCPVLPLLILGE